MQPISFSSFFTRLVLSAAAAQSPAQSPVRPFYFIFFFSPSLSHQSYLVNTNEPHYQRYISPPGVYERWEVKIIATSRSPRSLVSIPALQLLYAGSPELLLYFLYRFCWRITFIQDSREINFHRHLFIDTFFNRLRKLCRRYDN